MKTGRGGIRDIEFTVQFLQLLNGGDLPAVRQRNTLLALEALEIAGCLTGRKRTSSTTPIASCARPSTACNCCSTCKRTACRTAGRIAAAGTPMGYRGLPTANAGVPVGFPHVQYDAVGPATLADRRSRQ